MRDSQYISLVKLTTLMYSCIKKLIYPCVGSSQLDGNSIKNIIKRIHIINKHLIYIHNLKKTLLDNN